MRAWLTDLQGKPRERIIADQRAQTPHWSDAELEPWADSKIRLSLNVFNRSRAREVDWADVARKITCPALLITGDPERGAIVTGEQAEALRSMIPQLRIAHIPGAGHSIRRDRFTPYLEAVRDFLSEV
jgi:pimeloyl-ACP methyl ester carboxylesterase